MLITYVNTCDKCRFGVLHHGSGHSNSIAHIAKVSYCSDFIGVSATV